ncbi:MAG: hypothetical protein IPK80_34510 [Nannocystis sp.]|nr:hypothetical protein [Nannocystis sp.]
MALRFEEGELRARVRRRAAEVPAAPLRWLAIPTRDRPGLAARAAASALDDARRRGRALDVLICDDSADPATIADLRGRLRALGGDGGRIGYAGRAEKERFIAAIDAIGGPATSARFALTAATGPIACPGANRNTITLATLGARVLCVDDDVVVAPAGPPALGRGARAWSGRGRGYENYNPAEFWFFADRAATLAGIRRVDLDAIGEHEAHLGRGLDSILAEAASIDAAALLDDDMRERIVAGTARARVTFSGTYGDIGWYSPTWLVLLEGASRARLVDDPAVYVRSCGASREVLRVVDRVTVNDGRYCQSAVIGLDNQDGLPPFIPFGRYEDGVFRLTLRLADPDAYFVYLPHALLHDPQEVRGFDRNDIHRTGDWVRTGETLNQCLLGHELAPGRPAARLAALGGWLEELGRAPLVDLEDYLRERLSAQKAIYLAHFEATLARYGAAPTPWADDLREHASRTRAALGRADYPIPREFMLAEGDRERALRRFQGLLSALGRLFREWEGLGAAARALAARGITLYDAP